jgi:hypothetical protein
VDGAKVELVEDALAGAIEQVQLHHDIRVWDWNALCRQLHVRRLSIRAAKSAAFNLSNTPRCGQITHHDVVLWVFVSAALEHLQDGRLADGGVPHDDDFAPEHRLENPKAANRQRFRSTTP